MCFYRYFCYNFTFYLVFPFVIVAILFSSFYPLMDDRCRPNGRTASPKTQPEKITGLDLSFQGIRALSASLFLLANIRELLLDNNELKTLPREICQLRKLERLSACHNKLRSIPPELGKVVSLKELQLDSNNLLTIPMELGTLHNLEIISLQNNPLIAPFNTLVKDRSLIHFCRENNTGYPAPSDRAWIDVLLRKNPSNSPSSPNTLSVGTFNILCNFYASKCTYAPSWVINPDLRKEAILQNILSYNVDILCLQEIEAYSYMDFYRDHLSTRLGYASVFQPRERSRQIMEKRAADGAAIFWKKEYFTLIKHSVIDFNHVIAADPRIQKGSDIYSRMSRKDNMVLVVYLRDKDNNVLVIMNAHLYWSPEYADVKLFQTILLFEETKKIKEENPEASIILMGDFNSLRDSPVYNLIVKKNVDGLEFGLYNYSPFNSGYSHSLPFLDSYANQELPFTNFTPGFRGVIDYIFHDLSLETISILSPVENEYSEKCVGLPSIHFPSDHIFIAARLGLKKRHSKAQHETK